MNNIDYLISCIKRDIPIPILNMAFTPPRLLGRLVPTLDHLIKTEIITNWVGRDCNMVAGIESIIDITNVQREYVDGGLILYVGMGPTAGKTITSVINIGYGYNIMSGSRATIASALTEPYQTCDVRCQLVGPNTVYVDGTTGVVLTNMRCVLENDSEFNNINPRSMPILSDMCTLAAKAFIYNELNLKLSNAVIVNGIDMSKIAEIVSGYADANQMYREMMTLKWPKINFMSDRVSMNRHIRRLIPG